MRIMYICGETGSGGATFFRSTNLGTSFQSMTVLTPHNLPGVMIAVGPNGAIQGGSVYAVTYSGSNAAGTYNFHRSTNGGTSFYFDVKYFRYRNNRN